MPKKLSNVEKLERHMAKLARMQELQNKVNDWRYDFTDLSEELTAEEYQAFCEKHNISLYSNANDLFC